MMKNGLIILGAGVTGLAAGIKTGAPIFEAEEFPGGLAHSIRHLGVSFDLSGHWLFDYDQPTIDYLDSLSKLKKYERSAAIYFPKNESFVPYPIQNNLQYLPSDIYKKVLDETNGLKKPATINTMRGWLKSSFGPTLCQNFFYPFNENYTAGLYKKIAPQDLYKTPTNPSAGYNASFYYPEKGLAHLINQMSQQCSIHYKKKVTAINTESKQILFQDNTKVGYDKIISTLPLHQMLQFTNQMVTARTSPFTSVLVVNILAIRGPKLSNHHWLYLPRTLSGIYRVGVYSNVDKMFLPAEKSTKKLVSLYVEKAYSDYKPSDGEINNLSKTIIKELTSWGFIKCALGVFPHWLGIAYTWNYPKSQWVNESIETLKNKSIYQIGRFGRWRFQGMVESIKEGLSIDSNSL